MITCQICGYETRDPEDMVRHILVECSTDREQMKTEKGRYEFYKDLVKFAFEDVLKRIEQGKFQTKGCTLNEFRSILILSSIEAIEAEGVETPSRELRTLILKYAPELAIAILEYVGMIDVKFEDRKINIYKKSITDKHENGKQQ
ncbi:MAG TPA: hypothetical protein ENL10_01175 [Candidatus Cloacimonetes bacterium]|nr:hypothetical protein [Candidatus Cloacimonadota bacterium]